MRWILPGTAQLGLEMFRAATPSVLVLDLSLPGTPGQDVCREISQAAPSLPIIVLSAKTEVTDKVLLLELGAHDYVTKPFSPRELLARVRTAMRRSQSMRTPRTETFEFADIKVDFAKMELSRDGNAGAIDLTGIQSPEIHDPECGAGPIAGGIAESRLGISELSKHAGLWIIIFCRLRQKLERDPARPFAFPHGA